MKNRLKEIILGISALLAYFLLSGAIEVPFKLVGTDISSAPAIIKTLYSIVYELFVLAVVMLIFHKKIEKDFKEIKVKHKEYYSEYIKYWLMGLGIMLISNCILMYGFNSGMAGNEETIRTLFKTNPVYIYIASVFVAPILEELVFRQGIRNIFGRNYLFIIISGLLFGSLHVIGSMENLVDLLYIIPYSSLGIAFAYMLYKTDNIFVSIGFHFTHNGILMALQFITLFFS